MNIAIDASPLKGRHTNRGVGVYTKNLVEALQTYQPNHTYHLFDSSSKAAIQADIVHYPYFDPFFLTLPIYSPKPIVVTIHDLIPIIFPTHFSKGIRGSIKWMIQKFSLRNKQRIITDSESSKRDIVKFMKIPASRVDVIYLAPSLHVQTIIKKRNDAIDQFQIGDPYFLYVGDVNWNKNIQGLLQAFSLLKSQHAFPIKLVLVGKAFLDTTLKETQEIDYLCSALNIQTDVVRTGHITDDDLMVLYKNALALVQPSWYEGFGFPVLDAMASGCPVVCSFSSSLKEISGPSITVDPNNHHSIMDGMKKIFLLSSAERKRLIREEGKWVQAFSWQRVAEETIHSYEKALAHV